MDKIPQRIEEPEPVVAVNGKDLQVGDVVMYFPGKFGKILEIGTVRENSFLGYWAPITIEGFSPGISLFPNDIYTIKARKGEGEASGASDPEHVYDVLSDLVRVFTEGRNYDTRNPYSRPEVEAAMRCIAEHKGKTDWLNALD